MPVQIELPELPGHRVTLSATDPDRPGAHVSCSCGETLYENTEISLDTAHAAIAAIQTHLRQHGWRDPQLN
jgi:hypothetical protein